MKRLVQLMMAVLLVVSLGTSAQGQTFGGPDFMRRKMVMGGTFGAGIAGNQFYLGLAPQFGYRITRSWEAGIRIGYNLTCSSGYYGNYFTHGISGSVYTNVDIFWGIYLHAEGEKLAVFYSGADVNNPGPLWNNRVLVGGGYRQYVSENQFVYYSILYDVLWNYYSLYSSPFVIRVGYCIAFKPMRHGQKQQ